MRWRVRCRARAAFTGDRLEREAHISRRLKAIRRLLFDRALDDAHERGGDVVDGRQIGIGIGLRGRPVEDDALFVGYLSGSRTVEVDREQRGVLQPVLGRHGVTGSHANGVLTFAVPRRLLDGASAIGFGVVSADLVGPGESEGEEFEGEIEALDAAPDDLESLYPYRLANPGPLVLRATGVAASSAPRAGRGVTLRVVVRRLDTYHVVRRGSVSCNASVSGKRVRGTGRFRRGAAECALVLAGRAGSVLQGTITVRAAGAVSRSSFRYVLR